MPNQYNGCNKIWNNRLLKIRSMFHALQIATLQSFPTLQMLNLANIQLTLIIF